MFYEKELDFLRGVLHKNRVRTLVMNKSELLSEMRSSHAKENFGQIPVYHSAIYQTLDGIGEGTMYKLKDALGLCFIFLLLPDAEPGSVLLIGPYHTEIPSPIQILKTGKNNGISAKRQKYFKEYLLGIPVVPEASPLLLMLDHFCELIWKSQSFAIVDVNRQDAAPASPINEPLKEDDLDDVLVNIKTMEMRYSFENELMRAVSLGQLHMEKRLLSAFSDRAFEKRTSDLLRNAKNYGVIMNTLLRKAAESGGVHPVYLDRVSSEFALKIEQMEALSESGTLMGEMFRTYCRLVRKHTLQHLSSIVQKTVLLIDADLSANLSPGLLAKKQSVSLGYLSTIFKRETGKTISEYIRKKRIGYAAHLLSTTDLQVQVVALHCGIMDVQYFSKIFKRQTGKTPKEYRESQTGKGVTTFAVPTVRSPL